MSEGEHANRSVIADALVDRQSTRRRKRRDSARGRALPLVVAAAAAHLLLACQPAAPISEEAYEALLTEKMDSLGFTIARLQPHWRPLAVSGATVLGWSNGRASIHLYHYQSQNAGDVMSNIASAFDFDSEVSLVNWRTRARGVSGLNILPGDQVFFSKYVVIPSETGRDTFALDYMERLPAEVTRSIMTPGDVDRVAAQLDGVYTFDRLVEAFSPHRIGSGPPQGMIVDRAAEERVLEYLRLSPPTDPRE